MEHVSDIISAASRPPRGKIVSFNNVLCDLLNSQNPGLALHPVSFPSFPTSSSSFSPPPLLTNGRREEKVHRREGVEKPPSGENWPANQVISGDGIGGGAFQMRMEEAE